MATREVPDSHRVEGPFISGKAALEESRHEEAANLFRAALRMGARSIDEEAEIRCLLSFALEQQSLTREQLEVISKYEKPVEFGRLSQSAQISVLIRLGFGYSFNNDIPRAIALFNQALHLAREAGDNSQIGECYFGMGRSYRVFSEP